MGNEQTTDDSQRDVDTPETGSEMDTATTPASLEATQAELSRTRDALKKANKEAAERRLRLQEIEDEQKKKERADMDEVERLKAELADAKTAGADVETLNSKVEALETAVADQVSVLFKSLKVPAHIKPLLEKLSPVEQLEYLANNQAKFNQAPPPKIDAGDKGGGRSASIKDIRKSKRNGRKVKYTSL